MGFFKKDEEQPTKPPKPEKIDPAPWLGQVGDGATLESGERIARELRELREWRHHNVGIDKDEHVSADPEMPIPDVGDDDETGG